MTERDEVIDLLRRHIEDPVPGTPSIVTNVLRRAYDHLVRPAPTVEHVPGQVQYIYAVPEGVTTDDEDQAMYLIGQVIQTSMLTGPETKRVLEYWIDRSSDA